VNNGAHVLDEMLESGADVLSLDWRVDMAQAARRVGDRASLQGNLDPCALHASEPEIAAMVRGMAEAARSARGYIANLGHGCLPDTPVEGVRAFTAAVRAL
jgi:uroporphyrinogen decarboxylase